MLMVDAQLRESAINQSLVALRGWPTGILYKHIRRNEEEKTADLQATTRPMSAHVLRAGGSSRQRARGCLAAIAVPPGDTR